MASRNSKKPNLVIISIVGIIIILGGVIVWQIMETDRALSPNVPSGSQLIRHDNGEVALTGVVSGIFDDRPVDGSAGIIIDNKYRVTTDPGGDLPRNQQPQVVTGIIDKVKPGDRVEVVGKTYNSDSEFITIFGNKSYYLKKLD